MTDTAENMGEARENETATLRLHDTAINCTMFRIQTAASIAVKHLDRTRQKTKKATDFQKLLIT